MSSYQTRNLGASKRISFADSSLAFTSRDRHMIHSSRILCFKNHGSRRKKNTQSRFTRNPLFSVKLRGARYPAYLSSPKVNNYFCTLDLKCVQYEYEKEVANNYDPLACTHQYSLLAVLIV